MKCLLLVAVLAVAARAQIPSLGFCPEYLPMANFDMDRFAGVWHEAERYFQLTEVASRCVTSNYTKTPSGKYYVINEVMSRFTGVKRVLEGEIRRSPLKGDEGKLVVKYSTVPLIPLETQYNVLETDYDNYAVLWSCTGVGPVHTQNAWIMTRQRLAPGDVLQKAYGVLDRHKISKVFFVKTNQDDCAYLEDSQAKPPTAEPSKKPVAAPAPEAAEASPVGEAEEAPAPLAGKSAAEVRQHIVPDAPEAVIQTRRAELEAKERLAAAEPVRAPAIQQPVVEPIQADEAVRSVPEVIMKIADQAKQESEIPALKSSVELPQEKETPVQAALEETKKQPESAATLEAVVELTKEQPTPVLAAIDRIDQEQEPNKPVQIPAVEPVVAEATREAASVVPKKEAVVAAAPVVPEKEAVVAAAPVVPEKEAVVAAAPAVAEPEVKEPESQPLKKPEPIVEEKIEIAQP